MPNEEQQRGEAVMGRAKRHGVTGLFTKRKKIKIKITISCNQNSPENFSSQMLFAMIKIATDSYFSNFYLGK